MLDLKYCHTYKTYASGRQIGDLTADIINVTLGNTMSSKPQRDLFTVCVDTGQQTVATFCSPDCDTTQTATFRSTRNITFYPHTVQPHKQLQAERNGGGGLTHLSV